MQNEPPSAGSEIPAIDAVPRCAFVTGPRGAGKTRWVQRQVRGVIGEHSGSHCAILLAEEGRTRMERFCKETPGVSVRRLLLPCMCCPGLADLSGVLKEFVAEVQPGWLFVEVPALAAAGLLAEFDRVVGWPRKLDVCLDAGWTLALRDNSLAPFQLALLGLANLVIPDNSSVESRKGDSGVTGRANLNDPA